MGSMKQKRWRWNFVELMEKRWRFQSYLLFLRRPISATFRECRPYLRYGYLVALYPRLARAGHRDIASSGGLADRFSPLLVREQEGQSWLTH